MASSPKFVCLFFFLTIFVSSIQTHARDSQFFSKVTRNRDDATPTTINPNPNNNYFTNKVDDFVPLNKQEKKDEQPVFLPQTSEETGYGLYGHETGVDAPSTTTNSLYNMDENNNNNNNMNNKNNQKYESFNNYYKNNYESDNHEKNNYTPELKGLSYNYNNNNFNDQGKFYDNNNNNFNDQGKFYDNNNFNDQGKFYDNNNNNNNKFENSNFNENKESRKNYYGGSQINHNGGVEKQGMSDTRFMENGKYYYDVDAENKNNKFNNDNYMSYNNNYNTNGYYDGNKETNYEDVYNNNKRYNNKFYNGNGMQEEFDFDQP